MVVERETLVQVRLMLAAQTQQKKVCFCNYSFEELLLSEILLVPVLQNNEHLDVQKKQRQRKESDCV